MFWVDEKRKSVSNEQDSTTKTTITNQQVVSNYNKKTIETHERCIEEYSIISHYPMLKRLQHFLCHFCHPVPSGTLETSTAASGNHSPISLPKRTKSIVALGSKVCQHHLELEPLCCLSSCLIRGGCLSVIVFEYIYVIFTFITIILRLHSIGLSQLLSPLEISYNSIITHTILLYIILIYDMVVIIIATGLLRGILTFNKQLIRMHLYFDYFALTFNVITSILFLPALFLTNSDARNFTNILLILCFLTQIPLQIWAIVVTRSCLEFFLLVHVLVGLAEK